MKQIVNKILAKLENKYKILFLKNKKTLKYLRVLTTKIVAITRLELVTSGL